MLMKKLNYILRQAFKSLWRNRMMGLASVGSVTAVLIILGFVLIIVLNVNNITLATKEAFDEIAVYLHDDVEGAQLEQLGKSFKEIDGVMGVAFQTKEYAMERYKEEWGDDAWMLENLRGNPLPDAYIIQLTDVQYADSVKSTIETFEEVESAHYYQDAVNTLIKISDFVKRGGSGVIIILLLISVFIISNTIKITVLNRQKEIELMQYIGATNGYVRGPLLIEGLMLGLIGSIAAIVIIFFSYNYLIKRLAGGYVAIVTGMAGYVVGIDMILNDLIIIFLTIGIGIGILGSLISLKKFLSV